MGWANNRAKYNLGQIKRVELRDVWEGLGWIAYSLVALMHAVKRPTAS